MSATRAAGRGAVAGVVGGLAFGAAMLDLGLLPSIASLVRAESDVVGFAVHIVVAAVIGAGFGLFTDVQRPAADETLYWGLVYGAGWWFLGATTLLPLLSGQPLAWDVASARALLPALIGHLVYGIVTAAAYVVLCRGEVPITVDRASLASGAVAGVVGAILLAAVAGGGADAVGGLDAPVVSASMVDRAGPVAWLVTIALGLVVGLGYGLLHPRARTGAGPGVVRGLAYGFAWWILAALTIIPVVAGDGLRWSVDDVRDGFATFPGYLLFLGAAVALLHHGLTGATRALFADDLSIGADEGLGTRGLRASGQGIVAGLAGGVLFTVVMVQIGFLSTVAGLVGGSSVVVGLLVHLVIAAVIGVAYGLLFIRRSHDAGSALGWGIAYGVLWWLLGPMTLLPTFLGDGPTWTVAAATEAYPALIGHIAYGAALGAVFFRLELRRDPWWISRSDAEAARTRRATEQLLSSAPGLWAIAILIALTIPVLLGGTTP